MVGGGMQANTETSCSSARAGASTTMSICKILQQSTIDTVTRHCPGYVLDIDKVDKVNTG